MKTDIATQIIETEDWDYDDFDLFFYNVTLKEDFGPLKKGEKFDQATFILYNTNEPKVVFENYDAEMRIVTIPVTLVPSNG